MSESPDEEPNAPPLVVPAAIESVIADFDSRTDAYSSMDVQSGLAEARRGLAAPSPSENAGAWAELLAFSLTGTEHHEKPWGTYFGPMGSGTQNGEIVYFPDVRQADAAILQHWKARARASKASVLVARYSDLVWDLGKLIANEKRDAEFARLAIDAYLANAVHADRDPYDAFPDAERALGLALQLGDTNRRDAARAALMALHQAEASSGGMWWRAWDALEDQPKSGLTEAERDILVGDLERAVARAADATDKDKFDPHEVESAANKLITHYRRTGRDAEAPRLYLEVAKAFEHFASLGNALLASMVLQTSLDAYRQAGSISDANRILAVMEERTAAAVAEMKPIEHTIRIPTEQIEEFLGQVVKETTPATFSRIAAEFMVRRTLMETALKKAAKSSPLSSLMPKSKVQGNRVIAHIGTVEDDPTGNLIEQANSHLTRLTVWLGWALRRAAEKHAFTANEIMLWSNRAGLFGDGRLLHEGVAAWLAEDYIKAAHILIPQIEAGFRMLAGRHGRPTTKAHPHMRQARMVITMGDMLAQEETAEALGTHGPDIVLHFRALYADPRGHNLRNDMAHGLLSVEGINEGAMLWVIHSLLLLGLWMAPVRADESPG